MFLGDLLTHFSSPMSLLVIWKQDRVSGVHSVATIYKSL